MYHKTWIKRKCGKVTYYSLYLFLGFIPVYFSKKEMG